MQATDIRRPDYFHRVVDCQWACPAHTPVPEYIRLIAAGRYSDAYMVNWHSIVFPGILGRTCDRPCEPACRRGRVEENQATRPEPVAICRLKRVAADLKDDVHGRMPRRRVPMNGRRVACIGAGPASLTVARDLAPLGYEVILFDQDPKAGGMIRTQIPRFRLPEEVIDEETGYVLALGVELRGGVRIDSMKRLLEEGYDAIFVGSGAPRGRDLELPGRREAAAHINVGIDWLSSVSFGHVLRAASPPVITVIGFQLGGLMGSAAVVEVVFGLNGVGNTLLQGIFNRDYPLVQAATLYLAVVFVMINLVVDVLYAWLDPRIKLG